MDSILENIGLTTETLRQIVIYVLILGVVWVVMRFIFKTAMKVFLFGCGSIVVLGVVLALMRIFAE
ncbi:MAG: hypothetical protein EHM41_15740 [Chloroflexi bacterium]|nr:MAG: hypothetical protein EHM41_15740 [Chloroflexota bacterium]